ncbi:MAG: class I SAM-dependent methyltransferase [Legionellales bacterium]|nr:class I SAM-dependent methyltransferase [Legionellales bacterium]
MTTNKKIIISHSGADNYQKALELSNKINIPMQQIETDDSICLLVTSSGLQIIAPAISKKPFELNLTKLISEFQKQQEIKKHPLSMAIGLKKKKCLIYDMTAGFIKDSCLLAYLGHKVVAIEKNPVIYEIAKSAQEKIKDTSPKLDLSIVNADSINFINKHQKPDIILIDPMFPKDKKTALVKKPMQILQAITTGENQSENNLMKAALLNATCKVIVKRPKNGPYINDKKPELQITNNQSTRFDIYLTSS